MLTLLPTLAAAALETALNKLLAQHERALQRLTGLQGRVLHLVLAECAAPLALIFSAQRITILATAELSADCTVSTRLAVLPKLRHRQQLIPLIRAQQLMVEGDLQLLQQFIALLMLMEWSPEAWLSYAVGDVAAHGLVRTLKRGIRGAQQRRARRSAWLRDVVVEEWRLLPGGAEARYFSQRLARLQQACNALERRISVLRSGSDHAQ